MNDKVHIQGIFKKIAAILALIIGIFHILNVSGILVLSDLTFRVIHLMFMMAIIFLITPNKKKENPTIADYAYRIFGVFASFATGLYLLFRWQIIIESGGVTNRVDTYVGIAMVFLILIATWKSIGKLLSIIVFIFLLYPFVGPYMPNILQNKAYSLDRTFSFIFSSTQGIYGIPISVSASYIILFAIYGSFLNAFGVGEFLFKLSRSLTSNFVASTAKTAIIFSALIGMISGSAAGNVAIAGTINIPNMKKMGYSPHVAGAIEAVASTGGQIMPPVMGAAAFIMAEMTGISYSGIMKAAAIPAILYFLSIYFIVHFTALKNNIDLKNEDEEKYSIIKVIQEGWYLIIPMAVLFYLLIIGYSPFKSAYYSIFAILIVYLISKRDFSLGFVKKILLAIEKGVYDTVSIAIACAASGIIVGVITMTGIGAKLSSLIISVANGQMFIAMVLIMITSIILGMGLPTTAVYLIVASVVAPALVKMGMPLLTAHLFVFFYGCISTITPPVALASYVAAGVAGADINKVGWTAFRYGLVSFILPFMFVYGPALLLKGTFFEIITTVIVSIIGVYAIAISIVGYYRMNLSIVYRVLLFIAGVLLINEGYITDLAGFAIITVVFFIIYKKIPKKEMALK